MPVVLILFCLLLPIASVHAEPAITGYWLTQDRGGVIAVARCGDNLCLRIAGIVLDRPGDPMPTDYRGVPQCGLPLVQDAKPERPNLWRGHITDPRDGGVHSVQLRLNPRGTLALRGYVGLPIFGLTEIWTRYTGPVPRDCRIMQRAGTGWVGAQPARSVR